MKTDELIKQCIKECIFEDGVLSGIITEVVKGMEGQRIVTEGITITKKEDDPEETRKKEIELEKQRQERIKRLNESASLNGTNVFEGTKEIAPQTSQHGALAGQSPEDAGVDISGILNIANGKWKHLI